MLRYEKGICVYERSCKIRDNNLGKPIIAFPKDYCLIDLETTGLNPKEDLIIEFAAVKVRDNKVFDTFQSLCDPCFPIPPLISEITNITDEMVRFSPNPSAVLSDFLEFLGDDFIIGHNVLFDCRFIGALSGEFRNSFIDTMAIFRILHPDLPHHRLLDMVAYYNKENKTAHRALSDCIATNDCFLEMEEEIFKQYSDFETFIKNLK